MAIEACAKVVVHSPPEVVFGGCQAAPAAQAIEAGAHVVGVSSLAAGHKTLLPALIEALRVAGREDIIVICGGVIPEQDHAALEAAGVAAIFGPGTNVLDAGARVLDLVTGKRRNA